MPYLAIVVAVIIGNILSLTLTDPNPLLQRSGLPIAPGGSIPGLGGLNTIDPNDGYTTQSLGVAAAHQLLHGQLPLWNFFEGLGQPLLAGMQSAALFPFILLMLLPGGVLLFHMVLQVLAGIGTLMLLRRLGLSEWAAVLGGVLFALNGTYAWLANAVVNPIAFLPWILLGIEIARGSTGWRRARGWWLVGAAVALSLLAGFPEVAYLNGLLAGVWALVRLPGVRRKAVYLVSLVVGVGLGVLIASPALIAFADYVPQAWVGGHSGGFGAVSLHGAGAAQLLFPYVFGTIFVNLQYNPSGEIAAIWGSVGGYLTIGSAALALIGLVVGRRLLVLRIALAAWAVLCVARIFGVPVLGRVLNLIPGGSDIAEFRYLYASLIMSVIVLAALGAEAILNGALSRVQRWVLAGVLLVVTGVGILVAAHTSLGLLRGATHLHLVIAATALLAGAVVLALALILVIGRWTRLFAIPVVIAEALVLFLIPQLSAPVRPVAIDTAPAKFLQDNLGMQRYFGLGILKPNYGSYYGIASLDDNNLPVPSTWEKYLSSELSDWALPDRFDGGWSPGGSSPTPEDEVYKHLSAYAAAGMKYLVTPTGTVDAAESQKNDLTLAYDKGGVQIWQLRDAAPYFSAPGCTVTATDRDSVTTDCTQASKLTRLELAYPGWQAAVDGASTPVRTAGLTGAFQSVQVPAGRHVVTFRFWPWFTTPTLVAAGGALLLLVAGAVLQAVYRRRTAGAPGEPPADTDATPDGDRDPTPESVTADV